MADFRINVIVDPSRVPQGTRRVEQSLTKIENRANKVRLGLLRMLAPIAGGVAVIGAVRTIAKFEEQIATAGAVAQATGDQFDALSERAQQLGINTRFSATQAAEALTNLARAGFSVQESIEAVDDTLRLATAGNLSLNEASSITAATLRGFRLEVSQAGEVTDILAAAANNANTNVSQLGEGIKFVAPVAAGLKQSIQGTTAALGVLSDAGLQATLAGTGLRRVLAELEAPSSNTQKLLAGLGVTADDVRVSQVGLINALKALRDAGIETGTALEIFGQRGGPAFEVLVNNIERVEDLTAVLANSGGTAQKVADTLDKTLNGALLRTRSAFEGLVLAIGEGGGSGALITILDNLSAALRLLADNLDVILPIATAFAIVWGVKVVAAMVGALGATSTFLPILRGLVIATGAAQAAGIKFTAVMVAQTVAAKAGTIAMAAFRVALLALPFAAAAAAVALFISKIQALRADLEEIEKVQKRLEEDAAFARQGQAIRQAQQELNNFTRAQEKFSDLTAQQGQKIRDLFRVALTGTREQSAQAREEVVELARASGNFSASQLANLERQITAVRGVRKEIRAQAEQQQRVADAQRESLNTVDGLLARLDREAVSLRAVNTESEIRVRVEKEIQKLLAANQTDATGRRDEIESRIRRNAQLERQRAILQSIRGPQQEFVENEKALNALLKNGSISLAEFNAELASLRDGLSGGAAGDVVSVDENSLDRLRESVELLQVKADQGDFVARAVALENALRSEGVEITRAIQDQIAEQLLKEQELTKELQKRKDLEQDAEREERALEGLQRRLDLMGQIAEEQARLNTLLERGAINQEQFAQRTEQLTLKRLEQSKALEDGFSRALIKLKQEAEDLAAVGEKVVNVFADQATDALVKFAETGQFSFKEFASAIVKDLIRIIARLLIVQALQAAIGGLGGGGGAAANLAAGASQQALTPRQNGGAVGPNRSFLVGENGPEILERPPVGQIIPNDQVGGGSPNVNVQVVNVQSEDEIPQAINDGVADDAIINALQRNKDRAQQALQ